MFVHGVHQAAAPKGSADDLQSSSASEAAYFLLVPNPPKPIAAIVSGSMPSSSDSDSDSAFRRLPDRFSSSFCCCAAASCSKPAGKATSQNVVSPAVHGSTAQPHPPLLQPKTASPAVHRAWHASIEGKLSSTTIRTVWREVCRAAADALLPLLGLLQSLPHLLRRRLLYSHAHPQCTVVPLACRADRQGARMDGAVRGTAAGQEGRKRHDSGSKKQGCALCVQVLHDCRCTHCNESAQPHH